MQLDQSSLFGFAEEPETIPDDIGEESQIEPDEVAVVSEDPQSGEEETAVQTNEPVQADNPVETEAVIDLDAPLPPAESVTEAESSTPEPAVSRLSEAEPETEPIVLDDAAPTPPTPAAEPASAPQRKNTEPVVLSPASAWDRLAVTYQNTARLSTDVVGYGPGLGTEADYKLLGPLNGKRFMDLGCGGAQALIAAAKQGAIAIGVDISVEQLAYARRLIEQEDVKVELKHSDVAELAFQRADGVDIVFSAHAFQYVPDLNRVFRQVHRVLKPQGTFVFSLPHPVTSTTGRSSSLSRSADQLSLTDTETSLTRSYFESAPIEDFEDGTGLVEYHRSVSDIFMGLVRSGYRVDVILEPELGGAAKLPQALIVRARKEA